MPPRARILIGFLTLALYAAVAAVFFDRGWTLGGVAVALLGVLRLWMLVRQIRSARALLEDDEEPPSR